ncbi:MAG: DEAD/DEAH box helicase [Candidatus Cryosericum sp.]
MPRISVDVDEAQERIMLGGDTDALVSDRYASRYLKDFLFSCFSQDGIGVPTTENGMETTLGKVRSMLKKYGYEEEPTARIRVLLAGYYQEEEDFGRFSREALNIRDNKCDIAEFREFTAVLEASLPARQLYPRQLLSAYHLAFAQNACNFSVPGAGKTTIVYGAYAYFRHLPDNDPKEVTRLLIVGPLSSFGPWETEYEQCFGQKPDSRRLMSSMARQEKTDYLYSDHTAELTLISYASLAALRDDVIFFLKNNRTMVVLDEAHKIKNTSGGIAAAAVLAISRYCKSRVVLTGTPAPNGYEDLYNLFKFIWPTKNIVGYQVNQLRDMTQNKDDLRVESLVASISPFFIRINKSDLGLPPATMHAPIEVPMGPIQQRIYDFIERRYVNSMIQNNETDVTSKFKAALVSAKIMRLMQAATNPSMLCSPLSSFLATEDVVPEAYQAVDDANVMREIAAYGKTEVPPKFVATLNLVRDILEQGGKVVIWATFIQTILDLKKFLESSGIHAQKLYGAIPVERYGAEEEEDPDNPDELTREKIVREFQESDCPYKVIIANPFAVGESISLHKACHNAIYIERTFNAAHFVQSKDRIHRYGLQPTDETNYYFMVSSKSIDETIDERLSVKEKRMIQIMESTPIPLFDNVSEDLGDEDIKALIRDYVKRTKKAL